MNSLNTQDLLDEAVPTDISSVSPADVETYASVPSVEQSLRLSRPSNGSKSGRVDDAYQEFCKRREDGEQLNPDSFCARFPSLKSSLGRVLQAHLFLEENVTLWAEPTQIAWPRIGDTFLDFHLLHELGKGAFARVFLAAEPKLGGRRVAIKVSRHGASEAEILGRIDHSHIVPVHSVQEELATGLTVVCMPYLGSATLCDVLDRVLEQGAAPESARIILDIAANLAYPVASTGRSGPVASVLRAGRYVDGIRLIGAQLADALAYLHERGIFHRDLKPSNVLMSPQGAPMLLDFNLSSDSRETIAHWGGTLPYMSPEQLRETESADPPEKSLVDARSDLFSLGVILYELLTGVHPFGPIPLKASTSEIRKNLLERQKSGPVPANRINPRIDRSFSQLIQRCLAFDPTERPRTAAEISSTLRKALQMPARAARCLARNPRKTLAATFLALSVAVTSLAAAVFAPPAHQRQYTAGMEAYQRGDYRQALGHFNATVEAKPEDARAFFMKGRVYQKMAAASGDLNLYDMAITSFTQANKIAKDGRNHAAIGYCMTCLSSTTVRGGAPIDPYKKAIEAGFATAEVYNNLGYSYRRSGSSDEVAIECFNKAIEQNGLRAAYHSRAMLHLHRALRTQGEIQARVPFPDGGVQAKKDLTSSLNNGISDVNAILASEPPSAEATLLAAQLYGVAAADDESKAEIALDWLTRVVDQGFDPGRLTENLAFASLLQHERFRSLLKTVGDPSIRRLPIPRSERSVDPIID